MILGQNGKLTIDCRGETEDQNDRSMPKRRGDQEAGVDSQKDGVAHLAE